MFDLRFNKIKTLPKKMILIKKGVSLRMKFSGSKQPITPD